MKKKELLSVILALVLLMSLMPAAFAAKTDEPAAAEQTEEAAPAAEAEAAETEEDSVSEPDVDDIAQEPSEEEEEPAEGEEDAEDTEAAEEPETETPVDPVIVEEGQSAYLNGGLAFNNGGVVYNNGGTVYNNGGITYNNLGIVYNNGGVVYNNNGTVYDNGGDVFNNGGDIIASGKMGFSKVILCEECSIYTYVDGLTEDNDGTLWVEEAGTVTFTPVEGYRIIDASADHAECAVGEDGVCRVSGFTGTTEISLHIGLTAPEISLASGTYAKPQNVTITAPASSVVYYTLDGSEPGAGNGKKASGQISIREAAVLKAVAVEEGVENSDCVTESYAFVSVTSPKFNKLSEGYEAQEATAAIVANTGNVNAVISSASITNDKHSAFVLSTEEGAVVEANSEDTATWAVAPAEGLKAGKYTAKLVLTLDSGEEISVDLTLMVTTTKA